MAAAASRLYTVSMTRVAVTAAITIIQIVAGATVPLQIIRAVIGQTSSTTSTQQAVDIHRNSVAATVTSFPTPVKNGPSTDPAAAAAGGTAATGTNASAEGTPTTIVRQDVFNFLNGWLFLPTPKEYIFVDATGIIGLRLPVMPGSSVTLTADMLFEELA